MWYIHICWFWHSNSHIIYVMWLSLCQNQQISITKTLNHHFWKNMLAKYLVPFLTSFHTYLMQGFQNTKKRLKLDQSFLSFKLNITANPAYPAALFWPFWFCPLKLIFTLISTYFCTPIRYENSQKKFWYFCWYIFWTFLLLF